jgi:hypothetical protein
MRDLCPYTVSQDHGGRIAAGGHLPQGWAAAGCRGHEEQGKEWESRNEPEGAASRGRPTQLGQALDWP